MAGLLASVFDSHNAVDNLSILIAWVLVAITIAAIVAIIQWRKFRQAELEAVVKQFETEAALKREMLERGMSADEIVQVLSATQVGAPKRSLAGQPSVQATADYLSR
jgi:hypothetical protein